MCYKPVDCFRYKGSMTTRASVTGVTPVVAAYLPALEGNALGQQLKPWQ